MEQKVTLLLGAGFAKYVHGLGTEDINYIFAKHSHVFLENLIAEVFYHW